MRFTDGHRRITLDLELVQCALVLPGSIMALYDLFKCPHIVTFSSILPFFLGNDALCTRLVTMGCFLLEPTQRLLVGLMPYRAARSPVLTLPSLL